VAAVGVINSLAQTTLKLTVPGVPDIYQGCELWDLSLVDPDNRRAVDFGHRARMLAALRRRWDEGGDPAGAIALLNDWPSGAVKVFVTWRLLQLRRRAPATFLHGAYKPVDADGPMAGNVCAFLRTDGDSAVLVVVPRLIAPWTHPPSAWPIGASPWQDTWLTVPPPVPTPGLRNIFTGEALPDGDAGATAPRFELSALLAAFPVGVWA
jgi:(1->4)-alpha-D-glucan 1-alpha-D-glucosylmutase